MADVCLSIYMTLGIVTPDTPERSSQSWRLLKKLLLCWLYSQKMGLFIIWFLTKTWNFPRCHRLCANKSVLKQEFCLKQKNLFYLLSFPILFFHPDQKYRPRHFQMAEMGGIYEQQQDDRTSGPSPADDHRGLRRRWNSMSTYTADTLNSSTDPPK